MTQCLCVPAPLVQQAWPHARALIKRGIDRGFVDWNFAEQSILSGRWQLWLATRGEKVCGACATNLDRDTCEIVALGGNNAREWLGAGLQAIENYARSQGCTKTRIVGRAGWERLLPPYRRVAVVLERAL